jgi:uncharacterized protein (TIGR02646 family)
MRTISRNAPPSCLASQPPGQDWAIFARTPCHPAVAASLREEQKYLCCYCELEIKHGDCHIEHMAPRSVEPARTYDYANLASSCNGGKIEHCGHFKDNSHWNPGYAYDASLFCTPHDPATVDLFEYLIDGTIGKAAAANAIKAEYMIGYLGLDSPRLTRQRNKHARDLVDKLGPNPQPATIAWAISCYLQPDIQGRLKQFHSLSKAIIQP